MLIRVPIREYKRPERLSKSRNSKKSATSKNVVSEKPNWCDLPYEMKLECMKWMDVQSKFRMRRAGRMEKEIFDTLKFSLGVLEIGISDKIKLYIEDGNVPTSTWSLTSSDVVPVDTVVKCAAFLMESAESILYNSWMKDDSSSSEEHGGLQIEEALLHELQQCESFRFSLFDFSTDFSIDVPLFLLKKCCVPLESTWFRGKATLDLGPLLAVPRFATAKSISYANRRSSEETLQFHFKMVQKWIENDAPIGNEADAVDCGNDGLRDRFVARFADRFVMYHAGGVRTRVRIRTDNPEKHIVFGIDEGRWPETWLKVIDASQPLRSDDE